MGSLACNGCSQLILFNDKHFTELKIHMIDIHKFVNKVDSAINLAFLNEAEEAHLGRLLQPRIKHFLENGNLHPSNVNVFERASEENEESDTPDIDESISDDEDDEFGEDKLEEVQDMLHEDKLLEHKLLEKLQRSVVGNPDSEKPEELNEKYLENLMAKLREDEEEEEEESDLDVKGGEEDNDSDTNPFSPEKTNPPRETSNGQEEFKIGNLSNKFSSTAPIQPIEALELQMSSPTSVATRELAETTQKAQIKIEKTVVVDVIVEEVGVKREKMRAQAGGSLKSEEGEQLPPPSDFCRLCYCRFDFFSSQF